jgi:hypothetical protein
VIDTNKLVVNNSGLVGIGTASASARLHILTGSTSTVGQIIQAAAGQTANLFEINSSSGSGGDLFKVENDGTVQAKEFWSVNSQNVSHYLRGYTEIRGQIGGGPSGQPLNVRAGLRVASDATNASASNNDPSAFVQIDSTTQGFLPPRMTGAQVEAISSPAEGLMAYATSAGTGDVTAAGAYLYNGSNWELMSLQTELDTKADKLITTNTQTASYTLVLGDAAKLVRMNVASANNLTIPPNSSVAFSVGTVIYVEQMGAGTTTIVAGSGVTLNTTAVKTPYQYGTLTLIQVSADVWNVMGGTV